MLQKLQCRECKASYEPNIAYFCEECFGPLEAIYDFDSISLTRNEINSRSKNMWRYKELLPLQPGDVPNTCANIDDLIEEFGYKPSISVEQGVENFVRWYQEYHNV